MAVTAEDPGTGAAAGPIARLRHWITARIADPRFQARAAANPLLRPFANRQAGKLYDLVAGFVYSQVLLACVELDLFERLRDGPRPLDELGPAVDLGPGALDRLIRAAAALDLLRLSRDRQVALGPLGAALLGAPGVVEMVRHHPMFYRDLTDPVALLRGKTKATELSQFWSYVHGRNNDKTPQAAAYSALMSASQTMVAAETLAVCPLHDVKRLMDVGGGDGAFLAAALTAHPALTGEVFDLPDVAAVAAARFRSSGLSDRARATGGSFRQAALPRGADAISLVRVLYDHDTTTARGLLAKVHAALPAGGRVIISEPMSGGTRPSRSGDAYFGFYTAAMTSGQPRSVDTHKALLKEAGFAQLSAPKSRQGFITRVVTGIRPR